MFEAEEISLYRQIKHRYIKLRYKYKKFKEYKERLNILKYARKMAKIYIILGGVILAIVNPFIFLLFFMMIAS